MTGTSRSWLLTNATVLDPASGQIAPDRNILVTDGVISEIGDREVRFAAAETIDLADRVVLPGLIDAHVHVTAASADLSALPRMSPSFTALHAARELEAMLYRGFTTVRDCGGADFGLAQALDSGLITGPRLHYAGKALSQTGGHGDVRLDGDDAVRDAYCCPDFGRICDGVTEIRRAARDELRKGATHLKLMLSGGVTSPTDRVDSTQFSLEEIRAAVEEAAAANRYVAGHAYTPDAIRRGVLNGVRSIEHGNFIDEQTAALFPEHGAFLVPTLVTYRALAEGGRAAGMSEATHRKVFDVLDAGLSGLEIAHDAGVEIALGSDLLGALQIHQSEELLLRAEVQQPLDIIRSATTVGARLLGEEGRLGVIAAGASADLLAVDGNPLEDISVLTRPTSLALIMRGGTPVKAP
jgi:imidazolonepropionase-like amidohydrolase